MVETDDKHNVTCLSCSDNHIAEESDMLTYVKESQSVSKCIFLDEETDFVGRGVLEPAMSDVKNLVEETSHMETKTIFFLLCKDFGIFVFKDPSAL